MERKKNVVKEYIGLTKPVKPKGAVLTVTISNSDGPNRKAKNK